MVDSSALRPEIDVEPAGRQQPISDSGSRRRAERDTLDLSEGPRPSEWCREISNEAQKYQEEHFLHDKYD